MHSLLALGMLTMDMVGTLKMVGLIGGIALIVIWLVSVKNTVGLFYEKRKIRATLFFGLPGIALLIVGIFLIATSAPITTNFFVANYTDQEGKVEIEGKNYTIESGTWQKIEVRTNADSMAIKAWVGDSTVFDTTLGGGSYIGNLGGKVVVAEEVEYSANSLMGGSDDLVYEMLMSPGIARFSTKVIDDLYDFDEEAPQTMSVSSYTTTVRKFDLQLTTEEAFFQQLLDALNEEGGGRMDSLMRSIEEEDSLYEEEELEEEE